VPTLSVIVPATDRPGTLGRCLDAVRSSADSPEEVLVIDEPAAAGPAAARNAGAERARGDVLVFVDSDVVVDPQALGRLRAAFADPGLAAVFGAYEPRAEGGAVSAFRNLLHHHVHASSAGPAQTFWAGLGAVRRDAFRESGGFDAERYPRPSIEDVDLGLRLSGAGARIELRPEVTGRHLKRWTLASMLRTDVRDRGAPWVALMLREGKAPATLNLGWRHRLSAALVISGAGALAARRRGPALGALVAIALLNRRFYGLLWRQGGPRLAAAGVGLHAAHHLASVAALPVGIRLYARTG
jgi:GT2 family glycosyltransferase